MIKVAVLDMNNNTPNMGLKSILSHLEEFENNLSYEVFDVRHKCEIPDLNFDIYISSGGPGDPTEADLPWIQPYFELINGLIKHNSSILEGSKKYVFFICHSFQLACLHFNLGTTRKRDQMSFGTFPCHQTGNGIEESIFDGLNNPFFIADFRSYEVIMTEFEDNTSDYPKVLAVESIDIMSERSRAIMAISFTPEMIGTQFHPEAHADGMYHYFNEPARAKMIIEEHGSEKLDSMIRDLGNTQKIELTNRTIIPNFLRESIKALKKTVQLIPIL